jgi:hypothetical protein
MASVQKLVKGGTMMAALGEVTTTALKLRMKKSGNPFEDPDCGALTTFEERVGDDCCHQFTNTGEEEKCNKRKGCFSVPDTSFFGHTCSAYCAGLGVKDLDKDDRQTCCNSYSDVGVGIEFPASVCIKGGCKWAGKPERGEEKCDEGKMKPGCKCVEKPAKAKFDKTKFRECGQYVKGPVGAWTLQTIYPLCWKSKEDSDGKLISDSMRVHGGVLVKGNKADNDDHPHEAWWMDNEEIYAIKKEKNPDMCPCHLEPSLAPEKRCPDSPENWANKNIDCFSQPREFVRVSSPELVDRHGNAWDDSYTVDEAKGLLDCVCQDKDWGNIKEGECDKDFALDVKIEGGQFVVTCDGHEKPKGEEDQVRYY